MTEFEQPIISRWHQAGPAEVSFLGGGHMDRVYRRAFETDEGPRAYAYKPLLSESEARRIASLYDRLRAADLPVVSFLKTMRTKTETGKLAYGVAMEDVTEAGKYELQEVQDGSSIPVVDQAPNPSELKSRMVGDLAVMHNLDVVDFHLGISFFVRTERVEPPDPPEVDFKILDYDNLTHQTLPPEWRSPSFSLERERERNVRALLEGVTDSSSERELLRGQYEGVRRRGDTSSTGLVI